jgi:hypothetical protein
MNFLVQKGTVIKPGPAGRPGIRSTRWLDRSGFNKKPVMATARAIRANPNETRFFFFQMWDLKHISIYTLCSQEKSHVFSMWDKKPFGLNTST